MRLPLAAAFGAALACVLLGFEGLTASIFFPEGVASRALRGVLVQALPVQAVAGAVLGALAGLLVRPRSEPPSRRWRSALPHLILGPPLLIAIALGDRDWIAAAQVGGVAMLGSAAAFLPLRAWVPTTAAGAAVLLALSMALGESTPPDPPPEVRAGQGPDVVVVVLDTVRRDRLALYGDLDGGVLATPALEALAVQGARFDSAYVASPWSVPSHASLFSGRVPTRHGATADTLRLPPDVPLLAEVFRAAGWATAGFSANPWVSPATGLSRGFEHWREAGAEVVFESRLLLYRLLGEPIFGDGDKGGRRLVREATGWLESSATDPRPFFLFVNFTEAHAPYRRIPRSSRREDGALTREAHAASLRVLEAQHHGVPLTVAEVPGVLAAYDAAIRDADRLLGALLGVLDSTPRGRRAVVVVLSDHGEHLGEDGRWGHTDGLDPAVLRVPLVVRAPGRVPAGVSFSEPVSGVDLAPTLAALAGVPLPGVDGLPLLTGDSAAPWTPAAALRGGVFAEHSPPASTVWLLRALGREDEAARLDVHRRALIAPPWRYEATSSGDERLFERGQAVDVSDPEHHQRLARMRGMLRALVAEAEAGRPIPPEAPGGPADPARREHLRALGYLD